MSTPEVVNGRPRWTDVLHQQEVSEQRVLAQLRQMEAILLKDISYIARAVEDNQDKMNTLQAEVDALKESNVRREQMTTDVLKAAAGGRWIIAIGASAAAMFVSVFNFFARM